METETPHPQGPAGAGWFVTTRWSVVLVAGDASSPQARAAMEELYQIYCRPLYAYLRRRDRTHEEAQDCLQSFMLDLMERASLARVDPARGRFRSFLLASLKNFLANEHDHRKAAKRGGKFDLVSWDEIQDAPWFTGVQSTDLQPDQAFERSWALTLLDLVMKRVRDDYAQKGQAALFDALQVYLSGDRGVVPYAEMAQRLGLGESALKMAIQRLRRRYGDCMREEVSHTVSGPDEVDAEIRALLAAVH